MPELPLEEFYGVSTGILEHYEDSRGNFKKYTLKDLKSINSNNPFTIASSFNIQSGTVRGLHFQLKPFEEIKFISCVTGSIFDVIVDLRPESKTFRKWTSFKLSASENNYLKIPEGFAHGYQVLEDQTIVTYSIFGSHEKSFSRCVSIFDKDLEIKWPLLITEISKNDLEGKSLKEAIKEIL